MKIALKISLKLLMKTNTKTRKGRTMANEWLETTNHMTVSDEDVR